MRASSTESFSSSLSVALKEWDVVCRALGAGRQFLLLRKGGIHESAGEFEVDHRWFVLFPTFLHQDRRMVKPADQRELKEASAEPDRVELSVAAEVTDIVQLKSRAAMDALDAEHIWTPPLIDMRFSYRPQNPLYLLIVRAYALRAPVTIDNTPAYAGCKSWVPLEAAIDTSAAGLQPALADEDFERRRQEILAVTSPA